MRCAASVAEQAAKESTGVSRKHSHRGLALGAERRADRLELRADLSARRSARRLGVVVSLARVIRLRQAITTGKLPEYVRYAGQSGPSLDAYVVDFTGQRLVALHDRRGKLIATFVPENSVEPAPKQQLV